MKNYKIWLFIIGVALVFLPPACTPDEDITELGPAPTPEDATFTFEYDADNPNIVHFTNTSSGFILKWDLGNGSQGQGNEVTGIYPLKGDYTVTLTIYTRSGSTSNSQVVNIAETDPSLLDREDFNLLTGGVDQIEGKTWVIDSTRAGHMGVGPSSGFTAEWWQAPPLDKSGQGMYDDEMTFKLLDFVYEFDNNGDVFANGASAGDLGGDPGAGDQLVAYTPPDNMNWAISEDGDGNKFLTITKGGFFGFYTGVSTYQILTLEENELYVRFLDSKNPDLAWYQRLIPKGYTPPEAEPTEAAPTPMQNAADVISVFSDAYTDVDRNLNPNWGQATVVTEVDIEGNNTLRYSGLNYQGLELGSPLDVTGMDFLHIDYWTDNSTALNTFLISSGPVETAYALSVPTSGWASVDIPLSAFDPVDLADVIQFKFDGNGTIYLDNIYFYAGGGGPSEPDVAAPTPIQNAADVISVFSDAYTDIDRNLNPNWGQATVVTEVDIMGDNTLLYSGLNYQGIELGSSQDVSGMDFLHIDFWTANSTALNTFLISSGPVETAYALSVPTSGWASVDIPLSDFSPVDLTDVIQFKFDGNGDIYLDNIYFYTGGGGGDEPTAPAPTPTQDAADVISMFSNAYTNVPVNTWRTDWSAATLEDIQIQGDDVKKYTALDFVGIETTGANLIDASSMTHFRVDIWTPNMTTFRVKLVDFGADGGFGGGDDSEHELIFENPAQGQWVSYDLPLSDFTGLASSTNMAQLIFSGLPAGGGTLYVDNVYFYQQ